VKHTRLSRTSVTRLMPVLDNTDFIDVFFQKNATFRGGVFGNDAHVFSSAALLRAPDIRAIASDLCDRARCLGLQSIAKCLPYTQLTPLDPTRRETALSRGVSSRRLEPCEVGCQTDVAGMS